MSEPVREQIPAALDGERVDRVVSLVAGCSRSEAAALVAAGAVRIDGGVVSAGRQRVVAGQSIDRRPAGASRRVPTADRTRASR